MNFPELFQTATGHPPYDWQVRLACGAPHGQSSNLSGPPCRSLLINIPTGLGKTAGVVLAWLWNRLIHPFEICNLPSDMREPVAPWPRRLVYCLPMRTLVEQTRDNVSTWLANLAAAHPNNSELHWLADHSPIILMGGEDPDRDWDLWPEKPAILIGTQDMLLSRALNRGYGMSRYRWPIHFALLNNDCLWIMDETQLMGVGLETSAQLNGLRNDGRMPTVGTCPTWWMSATLEAERLTTVDHPKPEHGWPCIKLEASFLNLPDIKDRFQADKPVEQARIASRDSKVAQEPITLSGDSKKSYASQLARFICDHHQPDSLTLVVLNRVNRAQEVFQQVQKLKPRASVALIHSRFRPPDRKQHEAILHGTGSRIVVATQAVEAGVDVSARTLVTELAPWPALVQRFGRCNRRGEFKAGEARVFWVDVRPKDDADELASPYTATELTAARELLETMRDVGPATLQTATSPPEAPTVRPILRRKDLVELFDTTPDIAGADLDVSRFIRDGDDTDVQVFWRDCGEDPNDPLQPEPTSAELCRVSLFRFRDFLTKLAKSETKVDAKRTFVFVWNPLAEEWQSARSARAGGTYLLDVRVGGYTAELGWVGSAKLDAAVTPLAPPDAPAGVGYGADPSSFTRAWVTLDDHTRAVADQTAKLAGQLVPDLAPALLAAARWHDVGKAHEAFQKMLCGDDAARAAQLWAKSANVGGRCTRRFFRHELASALAWLQAAPPDAHERDLVAYLIAAHHGKVRLSIRSMPGEEPPPDRPEARIARGILDGDPLGPVHFEGVALQAIKLDLSLMEMGWDAQREPQRGPSWLARCLALRERFGPFRLAFLETLLRAADARASQLESPRNTIDA